MEEQTKLFAVTKAEAEFILDSFKISNPQTRALALKAAGLCLEFASEDAVRRATEASAPSGPAPDA